MIRTPDVHGHAPHARYTARLCVPLLVLAAALATVNLVNLHALDDWPGAAPLPLGQGLALLAVLAFCAWGLVRHVAAVREIARLRCELDRQSRPHVPAHAGGPVALDAPGSERARVLERQRIVADIHDGLGAILISLLRQLQTGRADRASIERRVREALQEMRIAIDALQPRGGDLAAVLGSLRYRLDEMIRATGVRFTWQVEPLPQVGGLEPAVVFALQRILLEAIANALTHSGARHLLLSARSRHASAIEIRVEDDGCGFDPERPAAGIGLANMWVRAARIGAELEIRSRAGTGTEVLLVLPTRLAAAAGEPAAVVRHASSPDAVLPEQQAAS